MNGESAVTNCTNHLQYPHHSFHIWIVQCSSQSIRQLIVIVNLDHCQMTRHHQSRLHVFHHHYHDQHSHKNHHHSDQHHHHRACCEDYVQMLVAVFVGAVVIMVVMRWYIGQGKVLQILSHLMTGRIKSDMRGNQYMEVEVMIMGLMWGLV